MERNYEHHDLLSPEKLAKLVNDNINRLSQRIKEGKIIQVSELIIENKTTPSIKKFLIEVCKFHDNEYSGLYMFYNPNEMKIEKKGLYVGISRNLVVRLKDHILGGDPSVASFAVLIAREKDKELDHYFSSHAYKSKKSEKEIEEMKIWKDKLKKNVENIQLNEMNGFYLTAIPIDNFQELHATEPFVAGAFQCKYNSFKTH